MQKVSFFICRYLLLNIEVPFSTRQQAIHGTVLFTPDLLTPHTDFPSLPATVPIFRNVSTHFFYPCAHSVVASSTRYHLNRRKLNTYREARPPSWENGTWQVPSQLSHSARSLIGYVIILSSCDDSSGIIVKFSEIPNLSLHSPSVFSIIVLSAILLINTMTDPWTCFKDSNG